MNATVFVAVIGAAILHAGWNIAIKGGHDKEMNLAAVVLGHVPLALVALAFVPIPAIECFPYLVGGIFLHFFYQLFLLVSYQKGDLTQVYPIARGSAPLAVLLFSFLVLGMEIDLVETLGIFIVGSGIISFALVRGADGLYNRNATFFAVVTGLCIASYSILDGLGARISSTPLGYYSWLAIGNGILILVYFSFKSPQTLFKVAKKGKRVFLLGGAASFLAYCIVIWAFTKAPIPLVMALRETSIVFA